jgi:hypothetical protein
MLSTTLNSLDLFAPRGVVSVYTALLARVRKSLGAKNVVEDPKQTCVHLNAASTGIAFAGVHPRKGGVLLNIRLQSALSSPRVRKTQQLSRNRCMNEVLLTAPDDVDGDILGWLDDALQLASRPKDNGRR